MVFGHPGELSENSKKIFKILENFGKIAKNVQKTTIFQWLETLLATRSIFDFYGSSEGQGVELPQVSGIL